MNDEAALIAAIIAHPDEDTPRLAYADWLDENGQPERAEFIRVQIELTRNPPPRKRSPRDSELLTRLRNLLTTHSETWRTDFFFLQPSQTIFRRGFVEEVDVAPGDLLRITPALQRHPIRMLWVKERRPGLLAEGCTWVFQRIAEWPGLSRLHTLRLSQLEINAEGIGPLTSTSETANLRVLDLSDCRVDDRVIVALAESPHLPALEELVFALVPLRAPGALSLAFSSRLVNLRRLRIRCTHPDDVEIDDSLRLAVSELRTRFGSEVDTLWE